MNDDNFEDLDVDLSDEMNDDKIKGLDELFARRLEEAAESDTETGHILADDLLCELLLELGCNLSVAKFKAVRKWYA